MKWLIPLEIKEYQMFLYSYVRLGQNAKLQQTFHMQRQGLTMANDYFSTLACLGWIVVHEAWLTLNNLIKGGFTYLVHRKCSIRPTNVMARHPGLREHGD